MGFEVGEFINSLADSLCNSSILNYVFSNPIIVTLLLTIIILFLFYLVFRSEILTKNLVRYFIYIFAITYFVLAFHQHAVKQNLEKILKPKAYSGVVEDVLTSQKINGGSDIYPRDLAGNGTHGGMRDPSRDGPRDIVRDTSRNMIGGGSHDIPRSMIGNGSHDTTRNMIGGGSRDTPRDGQHDTPRSMVGNARGDTREVVSSDGDVYPSRISRDTPRDGSHGIARDENLTRLLNYQFIGD
jgi:hypothetical protein